MEDSWKNLGDKFRTIVVDPPWPYKNPGEFTKGDTPEARGAGSRARYGAMSMTDLKALQIPATDDAHLYLWTTNKFLVEAHELVKAWGFRPITVCTWVKTTEEPIPVLCPACSRYGCPCHGDANCDIWGKATERLPIGVVRASPRAGYYFRGATEHCLFAVKGKGGDKWQEAHATAWLWPRLPHSVKPEAFYDLVERVSPGPWLEMFARRNRLGWATWGDQALPHVVIGPNEVVTL